MRVYVGRNCWLTEGSSKRLSENIGVPLDLLQSHLDSLGLLKIMKEEEELYHSEIEHSSLFRKYAVSYFIAKYDSLLGWQHIYDIYPDNEGVIYYQETQ